MTAFQNCISGMIGRRFLLRCAHEHTDFQIPEIQSLAVLFGINLQRIERKDKSPFILIEVDSEDDVKKIMSRTVLVRSAYELWASAHSHSELHSMLKSLPADHLKPYSMPDCSFRFRVEGFSKTISQEQKVKRMDDLRFLEFQGPVDLDNPCVSLHLIEYYGTDPNSAPENPHVIYFGRWLGDGQRRKIHKLSLRARKFIGNTTMDPQLSLIMANQALVDETSLIYDPFVGTGSLLIGAATFGAYVLGADIDYLMLHGKAKPSRFNQVKRDPDESVRANFAQYGISSQYLDVVIADSSQPLWRHSHAFDAVLADPPYGIREATSRIGTKKELKIPEHLIASHIPSKVEYGLGDIYRDLLNFAAQSLRLNGRLVYWMPIYISDYSEDAVPKHNCLQLISNSEQPLTKHTSRRLITMQKVMEPNGDLETTNGALISEKMDTFRKQYFQTVHGRHIEKKLVRENESC